MLLVRDLMPDLLEGNMKASHVAGGNNTSTSSVYVV